MEKMDIRSQGIDYIDEGHNGVQTSLHLCYVFSSVPIVNLPANPIAVNR